MLKKQKSPIAIEIPLLFEARMDQFFDQTVFIFTPKTQRLVRAKKRGMKRKLFDFLDKRQWSSLKKAKMANYILHNQHKYLLRSQAKHLARCLLQSSDKKKGDG